MLNRGDVVTLTITEYAFGGRGIAKVETENGEYVVFVDNAFPGQTVKARIAKKRKRFAEAKLIDVVICTYSGIFSYNHMGTYPGIRPDRNTFFDDGERTNADTICQLCTIGNNRPRIYSTAV